MKREISWKGCLAYARHDSTGDFSNTPNATLTRNTAKSRLKQSTQEQPLLFGNLSKRGMQAWFQVASLQNVGMHNSCTLSCLVRLIVTQCNRASLLEHYARMPLYLQNQFELEPPKVTHHDFLQSSTKKICDYPGLKHEPLLRPAYHCVSQ